MCQLAAYIGDKPLANILLRAIENQEPYFGAHASGLAVVDEGKILLEKDFGHIQLVKSKTKISTMKGTVGIAHSRYSSKGKDNPYMNTKEMAHPFIDEKETFALMHIGYISNYRALWEELKDKYTFVTYSEMMRDITDSEVAVHLFSETLAEGRTIEESLKYLAKKCEGSFLFCVIHKDHPETIWIANWHEPCIIAVGKNETMFVTSRLGLYDIRDEFDRTFSPPKNSIIKLRKGSVKISTLDEERKIPLFKVDPMMLAHEIVKLLQKRGKMNVRQIYNSLRKEGFLCAISITKEEADDWTKQGISIINPYFEVLDMMLKQGVIIENVKMKFEGGVEDTPRFHYSLR